MRSTQISSNLSGGWIVNKTSLPAYQVVTYESFDYRIDKYPNLDAIEVVHSQNGATLVLIAQETKSFWFSSFLVSD